MDALIGLSDHWDAVRPTRFDTIRRDQNQARLCASASTLLANLESTCSDPLEILDRNGIVTRPALAIPSLGALLDDFQSTVAIDIPDRNAMFDAMRIAAEKRIEGILGQSRRRHYGYGATLVASCLSAAPKNQQTAASDWIAHLLVANSRRHAFKEELRAALKSVGLAAPLDLR
jgi:hypothetical protein